MVPADDPSLFLLYVVFILLSSCHYWGLDWVLCYICCQFILLLFTKFKLNRQQKSSGGSRVGTKGGDVNTVN